MLSSVQLYALSTIVFQKYQQNQRYNHVRQQCKPARVYAMTQSLIHVLNSTCRRAECCQVPESKGNPAKKPMYPRT